MPRDLSIEYYEKPVLITTRTIASRLWFSNNRRLKRLFVTYLAKYQLKYQVIIYGFIIMDNHYHLIASFPLGNRADFLRSYNGILAKITARVCPQFIDGRLWARRAKIQVFERKEDLEHWFFYLSLNPVSSGLVEFISDYDSYNSFLDSVSGNNPKFKMIDWEEYRRRFLEDPFTKPEDCYKEYTLIFTRLSDYKNLSTEEYRKLMKNKLEERRKALVKERRSKKKGFAGKKNLEKVKPGALPKETKKSKRNSKRPIILTLCVETKSQFLKEYFSIVNQYKEASELYRKGMENIIFPRGTTKPYIFNL